MWISVALLTVAASLNLVAALGAPAQSRADGYTVDVMAPQAVYLAAALLLLCAAVLRVLGHAEVGRVIFVLAALAVVGAPLIYGALTQQFTWSHHAVRAAIVAGLAVAYWKL